MQHDHILKKFNFGLSSTPLVHLTGSDLELQTEILFDMFHIYCCSACKFQQKILTIALVIAQLKYLTLGGVKRGGVKLWHCHAYLQALGNHGV